MSGNDGRKLLRFFAETKPTELPFKHVFTALAEIQKFAVARFLSDQEVDAPKTAIDSFSSIYRQENLSLINKLHELECHVLEFVKKFGSWGLYGDQFKIFYIKTLKINFQALRRFISMETKLTIDRKTRINRFHWIYLSGVMFY